MNLYWTTFKLYLIWFIAVHLAGLFVLVGTNIIFSILTVIVCTMAIYYIAQPSVKRYQYFFNNHGHSALKIFVLISITHLILFTLVSVIASFLRNA